MICKITAIGVVLTAVSAGWSQMEGPLSFEVASVKPAVPCCAPGQWRGNRPGIDRIDFQYTTLWYDITYAYGVKSYQVFGPEWLKDARYDIVAKGPAGTRRDQLPQMMQTLLAERFKLQVHRETREISGLALVAGKNGPKLKEAPAESGDGLGGAHYGMSISAAGVERLEVRGATMSSLVNTLSSLVGRPVVDRTGLTGRYDFTLEFSRNETQGAGGAGGFNEPPPLPPPGQGPEITTSIYTSIQQLGLRLDALKFPVDVIVVDHAEKTPVEN